MLFTKLVSQQIFQPCIVDNTDRYKCSLIKTEKIATAVFGIKTDPNSNNKATLKMQMSSLPIV